MHPSMRMISLHAIAYGLAYLIVAIAFVGLMGIINKLMGKPFLYEWKSRLFWFTFTLVVGALFDLVPRGLQVFAGVPAGVLLLVVVLWIFVKPPTRKRKHDARGDESLSLNGRPSDEDMATAALLGPPRGR